VYERKKLYSLEGGGRRGVPGSGALVSSMFDVGLPRIRMLVVPGQVSQSCCMLIMNPVILLGVHVCTSYTYLWTIFIF
jgi:hypothetical protein